MSRGRFAPSPTGGLHLGNARTALFAWMRARTAGSSFVMRVEDLDRERSREQWVGGNLDELRWLGLDWDEGPDIGGPHAPYRQSQREALYLAALERLETTGAVFECYLSRRELREVASAPHGEAPVYGPPERALNERVRERKKAQGKKPALRLRARPGELLFDDLLAGPQRFDPEAEVGDVVLHRADGAWAYQFAVVVDDARMGIEEVVRGGDLLASTAAQLMVYRALDLRPPAFMHVPLLRGEGGERLSKRSGALTLTELRLAGVPARRVLGLLAYSAGLLETRRATGAQELLSAGMPGTLLPHDYRLTSADVAWLFER